MEDKKLVIALAGNPNSGKTTLFNALTGSTQYVGNWPGVTVEKKEGKLKKHDNVMIEDLPGIYSLSPYTLEEVVSRNFLIKERPDAILNIVDGTNLERNLYLTTQLLEIGIPVVIAINMMDIVRKRGDKIYIGQLSRELGCPIVEISALKNEGVMQAAEEAIKAAELGKMIPSHTFSGPVEHAIAHIEETCLKDIPESMKRWYAIKIFEHDPKVLTAMNLDENTKNTLNQYISQAEEELDDDSESIITNERYIYIAELLQGIHVKNVENKETTSDKIDRIVTNRWLALPIFALVMWCVYFVSISTVGTMATDWANDGLFGDGYFLFGQGREEFDEASEEYALAEGEIEAFLNESEELGFVIVTDDEVEVTNEEGMEELVVPFEVHDEEGEVVDVVDVDYNTYLEATTVEEPEEGDYGHWVNGVPVVLEGWLESVDAAPWLSDLLLNGIVAGIGAVLGFLPQMLVLFFFLALLEGCGYMARIAFVMDRIFRKFGLSGKSFIPMLVGTGCSVPGIMASRTIESEHDRRMTVITTSFIPCSAKLPVIALIAGAFFDNSGTVATSAYFVGIASVIVTGIILKKTKMFAGDPTPFVMELPSYHWPTAGNIFRSMWERGSSFVKKAGSVILLATIFIWFTSSYGFGPEGFGAVSADESILAAIGNGIAWLFVPLGWGHWQAAVAAITGLIAKENVVGTLGVLYGGMEEVAENGWQIFEAMFHAFGDNSLAGYSFLVFNLLCAPCFAAIGAMKREMNSAKWTWFAVIYQCVFAYVVALSVYQIGILFHGGSFGFWTVIGILNVVVLAYFLFRPMPKFDTEK